QDAYISCTPSDRTYERRRPRPAEIPGNSAEPVEGTVPEPQRGEPFLATDHRQARMQGIRVGRAVLAAIQELHGLAPHRLHVDTERREAGRAALLHVVQVDEHRDDALGLVLVIGEVIAMGPV